MPRDLMGFDSRGSFGSRAWFTVTGLAAIERFKPDPADGGLNPLPRDIGALRFIGLVSFRLDWRIML
jgi:hypothetical protein